MAERIIENECPPIPEFQRSRSVIRSLSLDHVQKQVKIQAYGNKLLNGLQRMHLENKFCDVTIIVEDLRISCHRIILSSFSSYFESLFNPKMQEYNQKEITLNNLNPIMVKSLIDFAYSGEITFSDDNVQELLETANFLDVKLVCQECAQYIIKQIDSQNFLEIHELGSTIGEDIMISGAFDYIIENFVMLSKTTEFNRMPVKLLEEVLKSEKLKYVESNKIPIMYNQEESILDVALNYINQDKENRKKNLLNFLKLIRIGIMPKFILDKVKNYEIIKESEECLQLLDEAINKGPCYDDSDTTIWRKFRKNNSLVVEWSQAYANGNQVVNFFDNNITETFNHSDIIPIHVAICRVKLWIRRWDGRPVIGGIEVEYTNGVIKQHGGQDYTPGEVTEVILSEDELFTQLVLYSGFMIDSITFFTNKNKELGPFGGSGGGRRETPSANTTKAYLNCIRGKVVNTQDSLGIIHLAFRWIKLKTGDPNEHMLEDFVSDNESNYGASEDEMWNLMGSEDEEIEEEEQDDFDNDEMYIDPIDALNMD